MGGKPAILVTRPEGQIEELSTLIREVGGRPLPFPLLRISPLQPPAGAAAREDLASYQLTIFISRNAVTHGAPLFRDATGSFPPGMLVLAVGGATAAELQQLAAPVRFPQGRADSEGVLAMAETREVAGRRIVIVRGEGGRETLAETLRERGAQVDYLEVYRREPYPWNPDELAELLQREREALVLITSAESLNHFDQLLIAARAVEKPALLVSSQRLADLASELGYEKLFRAAGAESSRMTQAVAEWIAAR